MNEKKVFSYVNFAVRAGNVVYGIDNLKTTKHIVYCVLLCNTASPNMQKMVTNYCKQQNIPCYTVVDSTIDSYLHTKNCKLIGITNKDLSQQIIYLNSLEE